MGHYGDFKCIPAARPLLSQRCGDNRWSGTTVYSPTTNRPVGRQLDSSDLTEEDCLAKPLTNRAITTPTVGSDACSHLPLGRRLRDVTSQEPIFEAEKVDIIDYLMCLL